MFNGTGKDEFRAVCRPMEPVPGTADSGGASQAVQLARAQVAQSARAQMAADGVPVMREIDSGGSFLRLAFVAQSGFAYPCFGGGSGSGPEDGQERQTDH